MKIQYLSDVHDNHKFWDTFEVVGDIIVTAGDMGNNYVNSVIDSQVNWIWVDGNHEYYNNKCLGAYVRHLENRITDVKGQRFIGCTLWTSSQATKHLMDVNYIDFDIICKWHQKQVAWLWDLVRKKITKDSIIITHHAPSFRSALVNDSLTPAFCNNLDQLVKESGAKLWIHGHTHKACDYMIRDTRVVSNPIGRGHEETKYERNKTIEI